MNVKELAHHIDARLLLGNGSGDPEVKRVHAADTMSDLIGHAAADTLLVTSLNNNQLIRVAELMDVPGICLVGGANPDPALLSRAKAAGTAILLTMHSLDETCRQLEHCGGGMKVTRA